jgi:hypothetical protein
MDGGAVHADGLGDLGDRVLPLPVRPGGLVHAPDGRGLPRVQLGLAAAGAAAGPGKTWRYEGSPGPGWPSPCTTPAGPGS